MERLKIDDRAESNGTETELRALRLALEHAVEGISRLDVEGRYTFVNAAYSQLTGYAPAELCGRPWQELILGDDHAAMESALSEATAHGRSHAEVRGIRRDGSIYYKEVVLVRVEDETGAFAGHYRFMKDITRRKQVEAALRASEERFEIVARATNDAVWDWDLTTGQVVWNEGVHRLFGYDVREVHIDWWGERLHPEDTEWVSREVHELIETCGRQWSGEYRYRRADGAYAWVLDRAYMMLDSAGHPRRMIGSMMDITARREAEERVAQTTQELLRSRDAAESATRAKSEFLANVSHEIRTPMTAVLGFADMLLDRRLSDSERLNYAQTIRRNGEHLLSILNDILDLSKIEAGKLTVESIECSPSQVLNELASLMRVRAIEKGLKFDLRFAGALPAVVRTDPTRLRQVVLNLLSNAVKFTEHGSVELVGRCEDLDTEEPRLVIDVIDTGIGLDSAQLAKLFVPFSQADPTMTRRHGGSGLGLAISAALAAMLGGRIAVASTPGRGSTFTLDIGCEVVRHEPLSIDPKESPTSAARARDLTERLEGTILLAEDGPDNQVLIASLLRRRGLRVTVVENGRLAVEQALLAWQDGRPYDLVLMDMQMPELDGYGATAQLRARGYEGPVIALTAHAMSGERERCLAAGCDEYLTKPIERAALFATVDACVRRRESAPAAAHPAAPARAPAQPDTSEPILATGGAAGPLVSAFADDAEMADIIAQFVRGLPFQVAAIVEAASSDDRATLARLAHQLKGAAGGYGFPAITDVAALIERTTREPRPESERRDAVRALQELCGRATTKAGSSHPAAVQSVLVIDDSPQIHQLVEARLRPEGLVIYAALDAAEGLAIARERRPDLVLLDLNLPGVSGLDVCRQLKGFPETAGLPVVFLTSTADSSIKAAALDLGAIDYVTKPFDAVELRARVRAALRAKRYQDLLATRAQLDGLTGLWNRAYFDQRLREEVATALRHGRPFALCMADIDHFKKINDTHGHPFGDQVLQRVGSVLVSQSRAADVVCRYGGEEFAIILRETSPVSALHAANRMRAALSALELPNRGNNVAISASFGIASSADLPKAQPLSGDQLVRAADEALYEAKRLGRNRVVSASREARGS